MLGKSRCVIPLLYLPSATNQGKACGGGVGLENGRR